MAEQVEHRKISILLHPIENGVVNENIDLLPETRPQKATDITTFGVPAGRVLTADGSGHAVFEATKTYFSFPADWEYYTSGTTAGFCNHIVHDEAASANMAFLGELRCSDLPAGLANVEALVEIIYDKRLEANVIHIIISSGNVAPYRWEYTYWNDRSPMGWIGFQPEIRDLAEIRQNATAGALAKAFIDGNEATNQEINALFN